MCPVVPYTPKNGEKPAGESVAINFSNIAPALTDAEAR